MPAFLPILSPSALRRAPAWSAEPEPLLTERRIGRTRLASYSREAGAILREQMDREGWTVERVEGPGVFRIGPRGHFSSVPASEAVAEMLPHFDVYLASAPERDGAGTLLIGEIRGAERTHAIPRAILPPGDASSLVDPIESEGLPLLLLLAEMIL